MPPHKDDCVPVRCDGEIVGCGKVEGDSVFVELQEPYLLSNAVLQALSYNPACEILGIELSVPESPTKESLLKENRNA